MCIIHVFYSLQSLDTRICVLLGLLDVLESADDKRYLQSADVWPIVNYGCLIERTHLDPNLYHMPREEPGWRYSSMSNVSSSSFCHGSTG